MALIGTIRKNFWFVLILLGLALAAFVMMDMTGSSNPGGGTNPIVGQVGGSKIEYNAFQRAQSALYSSGDHYANQNQLWNYFVEKAIIDEESENLGIRVSSEELMDLQFGQNMSPVIRNNFTNPQTGQVNVEQLNQFKQALESGNFTNEQLRVFWGEQEKQVITVHKQGKLNNLVAKGMYSPTWMIEADQQLNSTSATLILVKIPFDNIPDSEVQVSDGDLKAYLDDHIVEFTREDETRLADYVVFDVVANAEDSLYWKDKVASLLDEFRTTNDDSLFAINNNGNYRNYYYSVDEMPELVQSFIGDLNEGDVYGPYEESGAFTAIKLIDSKSIPDSVNARHILRRADVNDPAQLDAAKAFIDSMYMLVTSGRADFDTLAQKNSHDTGSGLKGGDLGYFVQGSMVPAFNDVCFYSGSEGGYYVVESRFGVHLINILDKKYLNQDEKKRVAFLGYPIIPREDTQNEVNTSVADLLGEHRNIETLRTALENRDDVSLEISPELKKDGFQFGTVGGGATGRDMVRWMYDEDVEVGDVSPEVYTFSDPALYYDNKYVAVALRKINKTGARSLDDAREEITGLVRNMKKADKVASDVSSSDLSSIASKYSVTIDTVESVSFASPTLPGIGVEPKVIAAAMTREPNLVSGPIAGENGIYFINVMRRSEPSISSNLPVLRTTATTRQRAKVSESLMKSLRKNAKVVDGRYQLNM